MIFNSIDDHIGQPASFESPECSGSAGTFQEALRKPVDLELQKVKFRLNEFLVNVRIGLSRGDILSFVTVAIGLNEILENYKKYLASLDPQQPEIVLSSHTGAQFLAGGVEEDIGLDKDDAAIHGSTSVGFNAPPPLDGLQAFIKVNLSGWVDLARQAPTSHSASSIMSLTYAPWSAGFAPDIDGLPNAAAATDGNDILFGTSGDDFVDGGDGHDTFVSENKVLNLDFAVTEEGQLVIASETTGTDTLQEVEAVAFEDATLNIEGMLGTTASDVVSGTASNDLVLGFEGDDNLNGGEGDDFVLGGTGDDTVAGGAGANVLAGGDGSDIFVIGSDGDVASVGAIRDIITDFVQGVDKIDLSNLGLIVHELSEDKEDQFLMMDFSDSDQIRFYWIDDIDDVNDMTCVEGYRYDQDNNQYAFQFEMFGLHNLTQNDFIV